MPVATTALSEQQSVHGECSAAPEGQKREKIGLYKQNTVLIRT